MEAIPVDKATLLQHFKDAAVTRSKRGVRPENDWSLVNVAEDAGINLFQFSRDSDFLNQIWLCFLTVMKGCLNELDYKYRTLDKFLEEYPDFDEAECDAEEQGRLWITANWMAILFTMIPAAKNKGLVMQVIPQLVEGPQAKYVTGSGRTPATARRVAIYEHEGGIKVTHRSSNWNRGGKYKKTQKKTSSSSVIKAASVRVTKTSSDGLLPEGHGERRKRRDNMGMLNDGSPSEYSMMRRPRSGTGSSSTDGEFRSSGHSEEEEEGEDEEGDDDEAQAVGMKFDHGIIEEDDEELADYQDMLSGMHAANSSLMRLDQIGSTSPVLDLDRQTSAGSMSWYPGNVSPQGSIGSISMLESPFNAGPPLPIERINSWGGIDDAVLPPPDKCHPPQRLTTAEFSAKPAFPPEHPDYHGVAEDVMPGDLVHDPILDMFAGYNLKGSGGGHNRIS